MTLKNKPCARCGGRKGPSYATRKYCGRCQAAVRRDARQKAHRASVAKKYGMPVDGYDKLLEAQSGACALCERATGKTRRLSVDHDHACCPELPACGECVRGLLCGPCNDMLGHGRDKPEFFIRVAEYLQRPPAPDVLKGG